MGVFVESLDCESTASKRSFQKVTPVLIFLNHTSWHTPSIQFQLKMTKPNVKINKNETKMKHFNIFKWKQNWERSNELRKRTENDIKVKNNLKIQTCHTYIPLCSPSVSFQGGCTVPMTSCPCSLMWWLSATCHSWTRRSSTWWSCWIHPCFKERVGPVGYTGHTHYSSTCASVTDTVTIWEMFAQHSQNSFHGLEK